MAHTRRPCARNAIESTRPGVVEAMEEAAVEAVAEAEEAEEAVAVLVTPEEVEARGVKAPTTMVSAECHLSSPHMRLKMMVVSRKRKSAYLIEVLTMAMALAEAAIVMCQLSLQESDTQSKPSLIE